MKFRRRNKNRHIVHDSLALDPKTTSEMEDAQAAVAPEERRALLTRETNAADSAAESSAGSAASADPGQELLGSLGDFEQMLSKARAKNVEESWRDDTMGHLVAAYRVAKKQGWPELAQALADTGRILQTYVDGGVPRMGLPTLYASYKTLCLITGDQIAGQMSDAVRDQWQQQYQEALMAIKGAGLSLAHDHDGEQTQPKANTLGSTPEAESPFADSDIDLGGGWSEEEALPELEELPPLEGLLEAGIEAPKATADADDGLAKNGEELAEWVEKESIVDDAPVMGNLTFLEGDESQPEHPLAEEAAAPPKIVIDILDRLCDQLRIIEQTEGDERSLHLERLSGAITVLQREATSHQYDTAQILCASMDDMCVLAQASEQKLNERFMELAYAFGGVFMEATQDGETTAGANWRIECDLLIETWDSTTDTAVSEEAPVSSEPVIEESTAQLEIIPTESAIAEDIPQESAPTEVADDAPIIEEAAPAPTAAIATPAPPRPVVIETTTTVAEQAPQEATGDADAATSQELLEYAQKAAASGDGTSAKFLALRAAAHFARDETSKAEQNLRSTENSLRESMESTEASREQVKSAEGGVAEAASSVAKGENALGLVQERRGQVAQQLQEIRSNGTRIEEEIRSLQAKLESEAERARMTTEQFEQVKEEEQNAEVQLEQSRNGEEESRLQLEKCRQEVKDHQRATLDIEVQMHSARDLLTQQRGSLTDIIQTIDQISGNEGRTVENTGALLF